MKKIVALNLKMSLDNEEARNYVEMITDKISDKHEIVIFPSVIHLELFKHSGYKLGAQNVHYMDKGAYTGEISPLQLKTLGIAYALVGHSERRTYFMEDDNFINNKIKGCLRNNLKMVLCVGESLEERRLNKTAMILKKQVLNDLKGIDKDDLSDIVIAYEPVWAIGTGIIPRLEDIDDAIKYVKKIVQEKYNVIPKVLYGGSVNKDNIKNIMGIASVDGILVGSASFDPSNALDMINLID